MFKKLPFIIAVLFISVLTAQVANAQLKRKQPGEIEREAPDTREEIHKEIHDIRARERQMKATRVYTDMNRISTERKKMKKFRKNGMWEDYLKAKHALKLYKIHLKAERRRNHQMDVFD